jgi:phage-related minor tail protein
LDGAKAAFADWGEMADTSTKKTKELAKTVTNELSPAAQRLVDISNSIGSSFENAMMSAVRGTMSVKDAFRTMAADIIAELYRVFVVKQITGFISSAIMGGMGYTPVEGGGYTMRPRARPRAAGGPVSAGSPYLVGERGPELIVPNRSGTVIPNNKLGGGGVVVNQVINISTGVQQTVRAEIRQLMPQIADSAKAAVSDAKRRGGSYGRAFA